MNTRASVDVSRPGPVINKNIYGQFAEHLGRLFYGGLWVGPESDIPNTRGWRNDALEALKALQVPVLRWPGGCFSDEYRWRDGIGPADQRPVRVNSLWGFVEENNHVGTHEYFDLIEMLGAESYINCNMGTGSPREMCDWLEYLTSETKSDLAELRRKNGREQPYRVHHFGIGNETWGAGGFMSPEYYCDRYKHWSTMARVPWELPTNFVASGGHGEGDKDITRWTDHLSANIEPNFLLQLDAISFHYYTHPKGSVWEEKGSALDFPEAEWASTMQATLKMDGFLAANVEVLELNDPDNHIGLYVDEWGTWYDIEDQENPAFLNQQNSLRDALVAALNFTIFHKYASRVRMANIAQVCNVLQAMILTDGERMLLTPSYHVFRMYAPFQNATSLPLEVSGVEPYSHEGVSIPAVHGTAAKSEDGRLMLALVNIDVQKEHTVAIDLTKASLSSARGELLSARDMDAHNSFDAPTTLQPVEFSAVVENGLLQITLPPMSVLVVELNS